jgi:flagellar hook assembly protein FlgD
MDHAPAASGRALDRSRPLRKLASALAAALLAGVGTFAAAAPAVHAAANPKVAIIVGATGATTPTYRTYANQVYAEAIKYTSNVVRVYSPNATWSKVKAAVNGASIVVYMGHGNGWPSPYTYDPNYTTKDGFGLNADLNGDGKLSDAENKYYGEPKIAELTPAPNSVVLLFHLCYASGNSEPGNPDPSLSVAKQRVDNYASAFLKAGARAVVANGHSHDPYYIRALFTTKETIEDYWRNAPDANDHVSSYASSRTSGATYLMDPEGPGKYYRSLTGKRTLTTTDVTGASYASTSGDPSSFVVPGNASPKTDGAPVYGSVDDAVAGTSPAATVGTSDKVRIEAMETAKTLTGAAIYRIHTDGGTEGWMAAADLVPRDSAAPRVWETDDDPGTFSPNGDGSQDSWSLSIRLSEAASWKLRILDPGGDVVATRGDGGTPSDTPAMTWAPAAGSVADGTYDWTLEATDAWGNGPLEAHGHVVVDTHAPDVSVAGDGSSVPTFTPNGDGSRDSVSFTVGSSEPGTVVGTVRDAGGTKVDTVSVGVGGSSATLTWDGKISGGYVPDGRYDISIVAKDRAGNLGDAVVRSVDVYGALGFVDSSKVVFFPQDGDTLGRTTTFSFRLLRPATVTWTVVDADGDVVRTLKSGAGLAAGTYGVAWNGTADGGATVSRGAYRTVVSATDGTDDSTQSASVVADAFKITSSDATPARGQRITVTATTAEGLADPPRLAVYQPGRDAWRVTMTKEGGGVFRATITLKSSSTGTLRLRVYGTDVDGAAQASNLTLPLH